MTDLADRLSDCGNGVSAEFSDGILLLVLDAQSRLNAFNEEMLAGLTKLLDVGINEEAVRAVIITGRGRAFSSGQNLDEVRVDEKDHG